MRREQCGNGEETQRRHVRFLGNEIECMPEAPECVGANGIDEKNIHGVRLFLRFPVKREKSVSAVQRATDEKVSIGLRVPGIEGFWWKEDVEEFGVPASM